MKSTLVELPPDGEDNDDESGDFIRANSVDDLAQQTNIGNDEVLNRVLLPGKRFGSYHILGFVAAGGMGEIYAAQRLKSDGTRSKPVALKVITAEFSNDWRIIERFKREARISKAISSRHVARVYEYGESPQGHVFLAMELLSGEELFDRLHRERVLSPMVLAELSLQILKGLHQIHESGFVHRDIKPENIFLARHPKKDREDVKILDFGIAKRADQKSDPLLSVVGQIYGTPQYLAPEQAVNPDVDHRADLYSLGVVMYECISGSLPFDAESSYGFIVSHQNDEVPLLPSTVDPEFAEIIYRAPVKKPDDRYQSALEMGKVIKRWVDETSWIEEEEESISIEMELHTPPLDTSMDDLLGGPSKTDTEEADELPGMAPLTPSHDHRPPPRASSVQALSVSDLIVDDGPETPSDEHNTDHIKSPIPQRKNTPAPTTVGYSGPVHEQPPSQELLNPTTELRSPHSEDKVVTDKDTLKAQIITGVALGILILAVVLAMLL